MAGRFRAFRMYLHFLSLAEVPKGRTAKVRANEWSKTSNFGIQETLPFSFAKDKHKESKEHLPSFACFSYTTVPSNSSIFGFTPVQITVDDWHQAKQWSSNIHRQPQDTHASLLAPTKGTTCHSLDSAATLLLVLHTEISTLTAPTDSQEAAGRSFPWARPCDGCHAAPSAVYCHADAAYLCASCDTQVHSANPVASRHERVLVCVTCESAPAVLACHADSAALCTTCDAQVHSANPIAQRHQRVPVLPLPAVAIPAASGLGEVEAATTVHGYKEEGEEVDSWLLLRRDSDDNNCTNNIDLYFNLVGDNTYYGNVTCNPGPGEEYRLPEQQHEQNRFREKERCEYVVPSQVVMASEQQESSYGIIGAEQAASRTAGASTYTDSISNSISFSAMEVGIEPYNTRSDVSNINILRSNGAMELSRHSLQMPVRFSSMDREAQVLRYKEKKQARKFQKTIRYATRKTYAEARPRIKGRFAKISDIEHEVDHMLTTLALPDSSHGSVVLNSDVMR